MDISTEISELVSALRNASTEAMDLVEKSEDLDTADLAAMGHNGVRDAAKDAHNICNNLLRPLSMINLTI